MQVAPDGEGGGRIVWEWSTWDHLVQDYNPNCANYGDVAAHPELFDINWCPKGARQALRNKDLIHPNPSR